MAFATQPNVTLTNAWSLIADGASQLTLQLITMHPVVIAIGSAPPAAGTSDGHVMSPRGRDTLPISGLTGEKVYGRTLAEGSAAVLALTKG